MNLAPPPPLPCFPQPPSRPCLHDTSFFIQGFARELINGQDVPLAGFRAYLREGYDDPIEEETKKEASSLSFAGVDGGRRGPGGCGGCFGEESLRIPLVKIVRGTRENCFDGEFLLHKNNNNRYSIKCARHFNRIGYAL